MPVIFSLLHRSTSAAVVRAVLPPGVGADGCSWPAGRQGRHRLQSAVYRCRNVLSHAVEAGLSAEVVRALIQAGQSELSNICQRYIIIYCVGTIPDARS